ncbi:winged helix-turn-helix domain-containing protein [Phytoactinopolyspora limicola]|uniref:winged helix-turn-helix domain-containing protein n=1 Tax=Phytoactinopolyspora limicola TaxID=2715536 RepID=UPI00140DDECA|nr:winged helix-turn-helix domain-containing protein [Phytoactinopolyspora limicola]
MMWEEFDPDDGAPGYVHRRVTDHLGSVIEAQNLAPGTRLPGERALASMLGVSIGTVRRALEDLRRRGVVVTLRAKGTFVVAGLGGES